MGGFFGGEKIDNNFVGKITQHISKLIKSGIKELKIGDRIWQPTYTDDLAYNSLILLACKKSGVYNMASLGSCTFFELTKKIVDYLKLSKKIKIKKINAKILNKKELAKRPSKLIMNNKRLIREGLNRQRNWKISLKEYLTQKYFKNLYR
jgi:dTDP-4-dehydrorhamnose reductase